MRREEGREEQGKVLDELLVVGIALRVDAAQVHFQRDDFGNLGDGVGVHLNELVVVVWISLQTGDFRQALERDVAEFWDLEESAPQRLYQAGAGWGRDKDEADWDPVQEAEQRLQGSFDQAG